MAKYVCKNHGKKVEAWELGKGSIMEEQLTSKGKIVVLENSLYELMSQESDGHGEISKKGDFFKVDSSGYPYPNGAEWFKANHTHIEGDTYEQLPKPLMAWEFGDEMIPEIEFLKAKKGLVITEEGFEAPLWGTIEKADKDAVIIFYSVTYDKGVPVAADFNFVARKQFAEDYHYC